MSIRCRAVATNKRTQETHVSGWFEAPSVEAMMTMAQSVVFRDLPPASYEIRIEKYAGQDQKFVAPALPDSDSIEVTFKVAK